MKEDKTYTEEEASIVLLKDRILQLTQKYEDEILAIRIASLRQQSGADQRIKELENQIESLQTGSNEPATGT